MKKLSNNASEYEWEIVVSKLYISSVNLLCKVHIGTFTAVKVISVQGN